MEPGGLWPTGAPIVVRDIRGGTVRAISCAVVVEETATRLVTWLPQGSLLLLPGDEQGRPVKTEEVNRLVPLEWDAWGGPVFVWPKDDWWSARVSWTCEGADRPVDHWYINLHTPLSRTSSGFDIEDLILDAVVSADRRSWAWKDEADFDAATSRGLIDANTAKIARAAGRRAAGSALRGDDPFTEEWARWQPDPHWRIPPPLDLSTVTSLTVP